MVQSLPPRSTDATFTQQPIRSSTGQVPASQYYDCSRLLNYADSAEADCMLCVDRKRRRCLRHDNKSEVNNPQVSFGHPEPPSLLMCEILSYDTLDDNDNNSEGNRCVVVVAYTKHTITAQTIWDTNVKKYPTSNSTSNVSLSSNPMEVCILIPDEGEYHDDIDDSSEADVNLPEEQITCLTLVRLEDELLIAQSTSTSTLHVNLDNQDNQMEDNLTGKYRLAVVFGTNQSHLYTVELNVVKTICKNNVDQVRQFQWNLSRVSVTNSSAGVSSLFQVLPNGTRTSNFSIHSTTLKTYFDPTGGIQGLWTFRTMNRQRIWDNDGTTSIYLWVVYCDGRIVRLHSACLFPTIWKIAAESGKSVEDLLYCCWSKAIEAPVVSSILHLPQALFESTATIPKLVPLPQYHMSPLGDTPMSLLNTLDDDDNMKIDGDRSRTITDSVPMMEVLVCGQGGPSDVFPTFCFYGSEEKAFSPTNEATVNSVASYSSDGNTVFSTVTKALFGSAVGALRWGLGTTSNIEKPQTILVDTASRHGDFNDAETKNEEETSKDDISRSAASSPFPSLFKHPVHLHAGIELHDAPRQIESCSVDPDGDLAAATDSLGRVLLIDLDSKQVIRMWKGYRDSRCYWHHAAEPARLGRISLYLVIHCQQRRVVEVWKVQHGGRVYSKQVGRDARVVSCTSMTASEAELTTCYIIHSHSPRSPQTYLEEIQWDTSIPALHFPQPSGDHTLLVRSSLQRQSSEASVTSVRSSTLKIQHLQQLLSSTTVDFTKEDVETSLTEIKSLADLSTALDLLANSSILESRLGLSDASFHSVAVSYCTEILNKAIRRIGEDPDNALDSSNVHVRLLSLKIKYYNQIIQAYDVLRKFQQEHSIGTTVYPQVNIPNQWTAEATAWAKTYEQVTGLSLDIAVTVLNEEDRFVAFTQFASGCAFPSVNDVVESNTRGTPIKIYFNESSRSRREIIERIFQPLLFDVFAFSVVYATFDSFGIREDSKYLQKCFSEWFMTLPIMEACTKGIYAENAPMMRLLLDLVHLEVEGQHSSELAVFLKVIHKRCEDATDLVRAFMLGTLCREAVATVMARLEKSSYGKIQGNRATKDWTSLLRRLRVCLLVTLRLKGIRLPAPITICNVNQGLFSVFEWVAHDELQMTHDHLQIVSLEKACAISSYSFDPSSQDGDGAARFRMLQNSCLSASISEEERAEYLVDFEDDDRFGALLLYFKNHNIPPLLAAHRTLLLSSFWSSNPRDIKPLQESMTSLRSLHVTTGLEYLTAGICLEVWQSRICPIFRAYLFGFRDVQELTEDVVAPLVKDRTWMCDVGRITLQLLAILKACPTSDGINSTFDNLLPRKPTRTWPLVTEDPVLKRLMEKVRPIDPSALDAHSVIVCAMLVSNDIDQLMRCVPSIGDCFISQCLFGPIVTTSNVREIQKNYLDNAIFGLARDFSRPVMDLLELGEIHTLAELWNFDLQSVHTLFMLAIYEYGKDRVVDELLTKASSKLMLSRFVENGVDIACRRLNVLLHGGRLYSPGKHDIMSLLDADTCEWIKRRAVESRSIVQNPNLSVPIASTHLFILRLLSLSSGATIDAILRPRIHSLAVLSGLLVKAFAGSSK